MPGTELITLHTSFPEYSQPLYMSGIKMSFFFKLRKLKLKEVKWLSQACITSTQICVVFKPVLFPSSYTSITHRTAESYKIVTIKKNFPIPVN